MNQANFRQRSFTVRAIDTGARSVDIVASSATLDAYDEIVEQVWDLSRFKSNPVVLWNHNRGSLLGSAADALPIGHASAVRVENGELLATLTFVTAEANPLAENVWQGFRQKSLRAVSVGFEPRSIRKETRDGREITILSDNELFEISVCPMGANADAVAKSIRAKDFDTAARQLAPVDDDPTGERAIAASVAEHVSGDMSARVQRALMADPIVGAPRMAPSSPLAPACRVVDDGGKEIAEAAAAFIANEVA